MRRDRGKRFERSPFQDQSGPFQGHCWIGRAYNPRAVFYCGTGVPRTKTKTNSKPLPAANFLRIYPSVEAVAVDTDALRVVRSQPGLHWNPATVGRDTDVIPTDPVPSLYADSCMNAHQRRTCSQEKRDVVTVELSSCKRNPPYHYSPSDPIFTLPTSALARMRALHFNVLPTPKDISGKLKLGDHSIYSHGHLNRLISKNEDELPNVPFALGKLIQLLRQNPNRLYWKSADKHFVMRSVLLKPEYTGVGKSIVFAAPVAPIAVAAPNKFILTRISYVDRVTLTTFPASFYECFQRNGNICSDAVDKILAKRLFYNPLSGVGAVLTQCIKSATPNVFDNRAIYAKLWTFILGQTMNTINGNVYGNPPVWNNAPVQINMHADISSLQAYRLTNGILDGNIILVQNEHFTEMDLPAIWTLASQGARYAAVPDEPHSMWQTVDWPAVRIQLVITESNQCLLAPVNDLTGVQPLREFLLRLACSRDELDDCIRGLYFAAELVGSYPVLYLSEAAANAALAANPSEPLPVPDIHCLCTPWQECYGRLTLPLPGDSNILIRMGNNFKWRYKLAALKDWFKILNCQNETLMFAALALSKLIDVMTTTVMYSFQLPGLAIHSHAWPDNIPESTNNLLNGSLCTIGPSQKLPVIFSGVLKLLADCCGFSYPHEAMIGRTWSPVPVHLPSIYKPWLFGTAHEHFYIPWETGNPLAVACFLARWPLEWGISYSYPIANLNEELCLYDICAKPGWFALRGSVQYWQRAHSHCPFILAPYGVFALNVICQHLDFAVPPTLSLAMCTVDPNGTTAFSAPYHWVNGSIYHPESRTYQPCTVMSYNCFIDAVGAPCILFDEQLSKKFRDSILLYGQPVQNAGLSRQGFY